MEVVTKRLRILDLSGDDLEAMVDLWADPDVEHRMTGFGPRTRADVVRWLPETVAYNEAVPRQSHNCSIVELASGEVIGWIGFGPASNGGPDELNFGYALRRAFRSRGFGTEALRAVIEFCFHSLGARRFSGETAVGNTASERAMAAAGMRRIGTANGQVQFAIDAV